MSTIARQIAGASPAERLAEFQRVEPSLRKQFQEHLTKEGRPGDFDKEFPAILEQARERAMSSPAFGQQAIRHAASCQCESHTPPVAPRLGDLARRIAGPVPRAEVDASKVTEQELTAAMESIVKPKFTQWCAEEKVADAEAEWKAKLPKLTEDFKASKHFGTGVLAVRESIRRISEDLEMVQAKFNEWARENGLTPEAAAQQWESDVKPKAEAKIAEKEADRGRGDRAHIRREGENRMAGARAGGGRPTAPPTPGAPGAGGRVPSPYGANKQERKGLKRASDEMSRMEGAPSAKALIDQVLEG